MATTTNYGWTTPDNTALVKDGASAIRTLGSSIDTTLKAQIDAQIPDTLLTTTGDVIYASGASTPARLGIGTTGQVLSVSGGVPAWATPAAGYAPTLISTTTMSGSTTTISGIAGANYSALYLYTVNVLSSSNNSTANITINGVTSGYVGNSMDVTWSTNISLNNLFTSGSPTAHFMQILNVKATSGNKYINGTCSIPANSRSVFNGILPQNAVVSSISINGTGLSGTMYLLGA
jgi:hypothetical protein